MLKLKNVSFFYGESLIIKNISANFCSGKVTLLLGKNGAGKSTLLYLMAGLLRPNDGEIEFNPPSNLLVPIGLLGHQPFIYPNLTAIENLLFWSKLNKLNLEQELIEKVLVRMNLKNVIHEKAKNFSRGMLQRLNLARTFITPPALLLLDEPITGLDVPSTQLLYKEIENAKNCGSCIIWISHDVENDLYFADNMFYLNNKKMEYYGTSNDFNIPEHFKKLKH